MSHPRVITHPAATSTQTTLVTDEGSVDFSTLYSQYAPRLRALIRSRSFDPNVVDDLLQEVFLHAQRAAHSFRPGSPAWPWLASIAAHLCADARRDPWSRHLPLTAINEGLLTQSALDPESEVLSGERRVQIRRTLARLRRRDRDLLLLRDLQGWRYREIAEHQGLTLNALKTAIFRARERFKDAYTTLARTGPFMSALAPPEPWPHRAKFDASQAGTNEEGPETSFEGAA